MALLKKEPEEGLYRKIRLLMLLRLLFATFLLSGTIIFQIKAYQSFFSTTLNYLYTLTGAIFFGTFLYSVLIKRVKDLEFFAYTQLLLDVIFVTLLIYTTGGIDSIFSFMYIIMTISASIMLYRRGGLVIASASSILYGALLDLQYFGTLNPPHMWSPTVQYDITYYFYSIIMNIAAFYLVAILSSYLTEELRKSSLKIEEQQKDLSELEYFNQNIIQSLTSGLITLNSNARVQYYNRAAEEILGLKGDALLMVPLKDLLPEVDERLKREVEQYKGRSILSGFSTQYRREDGRNLHLGVSVSRFRDHEGKEYGWIVIFHDQTALKSMEEQLRRQERMAAMGELAASMAHELKNPLASLVGSTQVLNKSLRPGALESRLVDIVLREGKRLSSIVDDFLVFARPMRRGESLIDLKGAVDDTLQMLKNSSDLPDGLTIERSVEPALALYMDPNHLQQVLWNLFLNAVEVMPDGGVLRVDSGLVSGWAAGLDSKDVVEIKVTDTGPGVDHSHREKIFEPFFTTKGRGTGLGLAIVHQIVESYGGRITVSSGPLKGTVFTLLMPHQESLRASGDSLSSG